MTKDYWQDVKNTLPDAKAIVWDGCHKIYIAKDEQQINKFKELEYEHINLIAQEDLEAAFTTLQDWYYSSCALRFIESVSTVEGDSIAKFRRVIPRFAYLDDAFPTAADALRVSAKWWDT